MLTTVATMLIVGAPNLAKDAQVAFVARFYTSPSSKTKSHYHVYVSKLDGSKRRQISKTGGYRSVRWLDGNTLAWVNEDSILEIYSFGSGKVVIKKKVEDLYGFADAKERGRVRPWGDERILLPNGKFEKSPVTTAISIWDSGNLKLKSGDSIGWETSDAFDGRFRYTFKGNHLNCAIQGAPGRLYQGANSYAYLGTWLGGGSGGSSEWIYSLDPGSARVRPIISDFDEIDFDPESRYWAGIQPFRPLVPYGKSRFVWANELWVGDVKNGKRWRIAQGLVHGTDIAIRPGL